MATPDDDPLTRPLVGGCHSISPQTHNLCMFADGHSGQHGHDFNDNWVNLSEPEPPPVKTNETPVWDLVIADMRERDNSGRVKYGMPLQANNGRDMLVDAYQEILDLVVYLRGEIERRKLPPVGVSYFDHKRQ